ncbi:AfsR/SARP family transcriptional regulator [Nonomuraea sp. NPDC001699]
MLIPLLGPVELERAGKIIPIRPPQVALALAAPAWKVGHVVSEETLENRIWGEQVPNGARKTLYTIITQIHREVLGDDGDVLGRLGGYLLDVDESAVDVTRFRTLAERAVTAPDPGPLLEEVLTLWRGEPLAGVPGEWVERARRALGEERKEVSLRWARAVTDPGAAVAALAPLIEALHCGGRTAEALARFANMALRSGPCHQTQSSCE